MITARTILMRKILMLAVIGLLTSVAWSAELREDARGGNCTRSLDEALLSHSRSARDLVRSRGVADVAAEGRADLQFLSKHSQSILLLFDMEDKTVCGHVIAMDSSSEPKVLLRYTVGTADELNRLIEEFRAALNLEALQSARAPKPVRGLTAEVSRGNGPLQTPAKAIENLSATLFPGRLALLMENTKQLLIVPVLNLGAIPFATLEPVGWNAALIERLSYVVLPNLFERSLGKFGDAAWSGTSQDKALVIGDPDLRRHSDWRFPELPGAKKEALYVANKIPGWTFLGMAATRGALMAHSDADVIYIASHGISDPRNPLDDGFIALADALVTPREIQSSLRFKGNPLVVLSACQTGLGMAHEGGMIGLARAFQIAGAFGVVMSLWSVDDDATYFLMMRFVDELNNLAPADALRVAMLEARKKFSSPALWASFSYFGTPLLNGITR